MKKIILFAVLFAMFLPCFASSQKDFDKCSIFVENTKNNYNLDNAIKALECNYKLDKAELTPNERININNEILKNLVNFNMMRHEITQDKKYIKAAYKYSFEAIKNNTKNTDTVKIAINLAGAELNTKKMIRAYDYLCSIDPKQGQKEKEAFIKKVSDVRETKQKLSELNRLKWANAMQGVQNTSATMYNANSRYNFIPIQTNCYQSGGQVFCNTYGF